MARLHSSLPSSTYIPVIRCHGLSLLWHTTTFRSTHLTAGFDTSLPGVGLPTTGPNCPGNNYGTAVLPANPVPHTETVNALRVHFRNWVMRGTEPPPSQWPRLADGSLTTVNAGEVRLEQD